MKTATRIDKGGGEVTTGWVAGAAPTGWAAGWERRSQRRIRSWAASRAHAARMKNGTMNLKVSSLVKTSTIEPMSPPTAAIDAIHGNRGRCGASAVRWLHAAPK